MTRDEFDAQMRLATSIVATWPKWKQNILADSAKPSWEKPREPVDNSRFVNYPWICSNRSQ